MFVVKYLVVIIVALLLIVITMPKWYVKNKQYALSSNESMLLEQLGDSALQTSDVPVAAIVVQGEKVIGKGYNTVIRNKKVSEHAEVNAISDAYNNLGADALRKIDRDELTLITTWEPCPMCQAVILNYNIKNVVVVKPKSYSLLYKEWWQQWKAGVQYQWNKRMCDSDTLQMHLFRKHPAFDEAKAGL